MQRTPSLMIATIVAVALSACACASSGSTGVPDRSPAAPKSVSSSPSTPTSASSASSAKDIPVPVADRHNDRVVVHGTPLEDPYRWLRNRGTTDVTRYLTAENDYATTQLAAIEGLVDRMTNEAVSRWPEHIIAATSHAGHWIVEEHRDREAAYPTFWRRRADGSGDAQLILDPGTLAAERGVARLGLFELAPDGETLAYTIDDSGFGEFRLVVQDLATRREIGPAGVERVSSLAWAADARTYYYTVDDPVTRRAYQAYRRRVGSPQAQLVFDESDPSFAVSVTTSHSGQYVFLRSESTTASEVWFASADDTRAAFSVIETRRVGHRYQVEHRGAAFYIVTDDVAAGGRLVGAPVAMPGAANWHEVVTADDAIALVGIEMFNDFAVLHERERGEAALRVHTFATGETQRIKLPRRGLDVDLVTGQPFAEETYRFRVVSPVSSTVYRVQPSQRKLQAEPESSQATPDDTAYRYDRIFAATSDATTIPISLWRSHQRPAQPGPLVLDVHGADGVAHTLGYSPLYQSLLDRNVALAVAHVRGGGEFGPKWHAAGRGIHKPTARNDLVLTIEFLIREGFTTPEQLVLRGTGSGATTVAALLNTRPELAGAAILRMPFLDVLSSMLDESLPRTSLRGGEWGNPAVERSAFLSLLGYCPYQNLAALDYPPILVRAAVSDTESMYWDAAKYVAKLRHTRAGEHPVLLLSDLRGGGHEGAPERTERVRELAVEYVFALAQVGAVSP